MEFLPVFARLAGRKVLVVGGGEVAERKVALLLRAGAQVQIVSRTLTTELQRHAEQGALQRVRGGAAPARRRGGDYPFALRSSADADVKDLLARETATLIAPGASVLVDNGTTAVAVGRELAGAGVTAMALSLHAAAALASRPGNQVIVPGGLVDPDDLGFTSAGAAEAVRAMRFDLAILGACAADPMTGLTVAGWGDAQVKRAAIAASRRVVLVATADKFSRTAAHRFGALSDIDTIVTTRDAPDAIRIDAVAAGIEVRVVDDAAPRR